MVNSPFNVTSMPGYQNTVVVSMMRDDNIGLVAINIPRAKTQSVKNMLNLLAYRNVTEGQVVFSDYIEFKTIEAKGDLKSDTIKKIIPSMNEKVTRIMMLVPCHECEVNSREQIVVDFVTDGRKEQAAS
jgi:hypothetical protein